MKLYEGGKKYDCKADFEKQWKPPCQIEPTEVKQNQWFLAVYKKKGHYIKI